MLDLERMACLVALALSLAACSTPPGQVASSGHMPGDSSDSGSSTTEGSGPTTNASATVASAEGTSNSTTDEPATTTPLDDSGTSTSTTTDPSATDTSTSTGDPTTGGMETTTGGIPDCHPLLAEVQYDPDVSEDMRQWVKLYNNCGADIDLTDYSLAWAGTDYTFGNLDLSGTITTDDCFIVGGPISDAGNQNPNFDLAMDFNPDMLKAGGGGTPGRGVALFLGSAASIMPDTIPVDAVIYGGNNDNLLLDANGNTPPPHVGNVGNDKSIRRTAEAGPTWNTESNPMPGLCPPF